jgi:hypothetical protein
MNASEKQPPWPPTDPAHRAQLTFRAYGEPFRNVLPAVCKTVSNIPEHDCRLERRARTCLVTVSGAEGFRHVPGATTRRCFCSSDDYRPGRGDGERMPDASKAALSIGLSLPDDHLARNAP